MYSPYLYGRRSEMLALRAVITSGVDLDALIPIIEPVMASVADLTRCMEACQTADVRLCVKTNPDQHELTTRAAQTRLARELRTVFNANPDLLPGFCVTPHVTKTQIDDFIALYAGRQVVLLYNSPSLSRAELSAVARTAAVDFHVVLDERISTANKALLPTNKLIDVRDHFNKLARNADYSGQELFSDRYKLIPTQCAGVGDYTVIGRALEMGGGPAAAVAIHTTYKATGNGDIWIEHFVSDDTDRDVGDIGSKFLQAARKLVRQANARPTEFGADNALAAYADYVRHSRFPGLPKNKEHQIQHHIQFMLSVLAGGP